MTVSRVKLLGNYIGQTILTFISILGNIIDLGGVSHYVWLSHYSTDSRAATGVSRPQSSVTSSANIIQSIFY